MKLYLGLLLFGCATLVHASAMQKDTPAVAPTEKYLTTIARLCLKSSAQEAFEEFLAAYEKYLGALSEHKDYANQRLPSFASHLVPLATSHQDDLKRSLTRLTQKHEEYEQARLNENNLSPRTETQAFYLTREIHAFDARFAQAGNSAALNDEIVRKWQAAQQHASAAAQQ